MSFKPLLRLGSLRWALYRLAFWRVQEKLSEIRPYLNSTNRVLDLGAGNCVLCQQLRERGYDVVPLDLENLSFVDGIVPVLYDGTAIPFDDDSFDMALVITVLHHAQDPDIVLAQLRRVAKRIIVIEEIYENNLEKYFTYFIDSLFNLEFFGHPRSNRTDDGWRATFQRLGLSVDTVALLPLPRLLAASDLPPRAIIGSQRAFTLRSLSELLPILPDVRCNVPPCHWILKQSSWFKCSQTCRPFMNWDRMTLVA